jgi:hypothetical protein
VGWLSIRKRCFSHRTFKITSPLNADITNTIYLPLPKNSENYWQLIFLVMSVNQNRLSLHDKPRKLVCANSSRRTFL